jgi:tetratricopeptide (TPR) repeat protein
MKRRIRSAICLVALLLAFSDYAFAQGRRYALIIGIAQYDPKLWKNHEQLRYADDDAELFYDFITAPQGGGFQTDNIKTLLDTAATRTRINEAIEWISSKTTDADLIYVFFSGHAVQDGQGLAYFMPSDANPKLPKDRGFRTDNFFEELKKITCRYLVLFADACHSGSVFNRGMVKAGGSTIAGTIKEEWEKAFRGQEATTMAFLSANSNQNSIEDSTAGHGLFSWYLVEGMMGAADITAPGDQNGKVTAGELYRYLADNVEKHARKLGEMQSPTRSAQFDPDFILAICGKDCRRRPLSLKQSVHENIASAIALYEQGKFCEAIKKLQEAIVIEPENATAHFNLGIALKTIGSLDGAITEYRAATRLQPGFAEVYVNLGVALKAKEDLDGAIHAYREAIRLAPQDADAHFNLGLALEAQGQWQAAAEAFEAYARLSPNARDAGKIREKARRLSAKARK